MKHTPLSVILLVLLFVAVAWRPEAPPVQKWEYAQLIVVGSAAGAKAQILFDNGQTSEKLRNAAGQVEREEVAALNRFAAEGWELSHTYRVENALGNNQYFILRRPKE